jgi:hypothetical protein
VEEAMKQYRRLCLVAVILAMVLTSVQTAPSLRVSAQDGDQCEQLADQARAAARSACGDLARGEACYAHAGVAAQGIDGAAVGLAAAGDRTSLASIQSLDTLAADPGTDQWGIAEMLLPADLPDEGDQAVTAVLFGDVRVTRPPQVESDRVTLDVYNGGGAEVNLRNGAGVTYDLVGQLQPGEQAVADGRNEQADWLRIQYAGGIAWVFTPLIGWDGDQSALNALDVLLPNDVTPAFQADGAPFQRFLLDTGESPCDAAPSGLLLQYAGEQAASLQVNQVTLEFSDATLLLTARSGETLEVRVLAGSSVVTARGISQETAVGEGAQISLGGDDGLTPTAAPVALRSYPFPDVAYVPLDLLPGSIPCMVGLSASSSTVALRVGPGEQRGELGNMSPNASYAVMGWAADPDGAAWWQLDTGAQTSWAAQAQVRALGACDAVAQVEPPPLVFAPPAVPTGGEGAPAAGGADFSPAANSVWQMVPGSDNMTGQCSGAPAINFCDHLAAITPAEGGIMWRGMEASPYYLTRVQPNVYAYSGPNVLGTGTVNMTLSFASDSTLNMTMSLTLSSEPDCQHIYYYSGTRNW